MFRVEAVDASGELVESLAVHFRTTLPAGIQLRVYRRTTVAIDYHSAPGAGTHTVGPFLLSPGSYTLRLTATDAYGQVRSAAWFAYLH